MSYDRNLLPDPKCFFESEGLLIKGPSSSTWKTTKCDFHGGSDSMRVNIKTGAFKCMNCGESGGDVLTYVMKKHGLEFMDAAKFIGAWVNDGKAQHKFKPTTLSPRAALQVLSREATITAVAAGNLANGMRLSEIDLKRLFICANRIGRISEEYSA